MKRLNSTLLMIMTLSFILALPAHAANTQGKTKHPIVLVHGLSGFDRIIIDYFFGIKPALAAVGANQVYTPRVSGFDTSEVRGEQLLSYLEQLQAITGAEKFNLIGHSQGGLDARYVASVRPDLVASVTSVGSPHFGSDTADAIKNSPLSGLAPTSGNALGTLMNAVMGETGNVPNAMGSIAALNSQDALIFNAHYPEGLRQGACQETPVTNVGPWWWPRWVKNYSVNDGEHSVNGVAYYSWAGIYNPLFNSNILDPADALLAVTSLTFNSENDGMVGRCSSHLGQVIRDDYTLNHLDQVNLLFGLRGLWAPDPIILFTEHAIRLKNAGL